MTRHSDPLHSALKVLRKRELCKLLGISPATLDRLRTKGEFPRPIILSVQSIAWTIESIDSWLANRPVAHHFAESF